MYRGGIGSAPAMSASANRARPVPNLTCIKAGSGGACYGPGTEGKALENDFDFYTRRAREEMLAADAATHPNAQLRHRELAQEYADRARKAEVAVNKLPLAPGF